MPDHSLALTFGAGAAEAAPHWDRTVLGLLAHSAAAPDHLARTLDAAPEFALGWAVKGLATLHLCQPSLRPVARHALARARAALEGQGASAGERAYVEALEHWLAGSLKGAVAALDRALAREPRDALAVKMVHGLSFLLGDRIGMLRSLEAVEGAFGRDHPHRGYVLGCLAFAREENGLFAEAEAAGRAGLELAADDAWGLHAVSHVYDMTARNAEGIGWLESHTAAFRHCNNFGCHVWWHLALFYLDLGDTAKVLELYDGRIRAEHTDDYRDIANGASMLVRLQIEGVDVGDRWEELAALASGHLDEGALVFADLHYLLALQGGERPAEADALIARIVADAAQARHDQHEVAALVGVPVARGLAAFRAGEYGRAFDLLRACRPDLQAAGGSHAQRDVFSRIMIEAGIRAGRWAATERELVARARRRGAEDGFTHRRRAAIRRLDTAGLAAE